MNLDLITAGQARGRLGRGRRQGARLVRQGGLYPLFQTTLCALQAPPVPCRSPCPAREQASLDDVRRRKRKLFADIRHTNAARRRARRCARWTCGRACAPSPSRATPRATPRRCRPPPRRKVQLRLLPHCSRVRLACVVPSTHNTRFSPMIRFPPRLLV
jgi:hypothetical protein